MKIDFHILDTPSGLQSLHYTCKLTEQIHQSQQTIYIHTQNRTDADRLDGLLWTYKDDSFLPHAIFAAGNPSPCPILIGYGEIAPPNQQVLVNLAQEIPAFFKQFKQAIEIVIADPHVQQLARERYKQYRDQGCELNTQKVKTGMTN